MAFEDTDSPNVTVNPLPNHVGPKINAICEEERFVVQRDVRNVITLMIDVFKALTLAKIIPTKMEEGKMKELKEENDCFRLIHQAGVSHIIQDCLDFLVFVQKMIDTDEIEFYKKMEGKMVAITQGGSSGDLNDGQ